MVAGDAVSSLATPEFLARADQGCRDAGQQRLMETVWTDLEAASS